MSFKIEIDRSVTLLAEQEQWLEEKIPREPPIAVLFKDIPGLSFTITESWGLRKKLETQSSRWNNSDDVPPIDEVVTFAYLVQTRS